MTDILERVKAIIEAQPLLKRSRRVVVAVSGGVDSMVLLRLLHTVANDSDSKWQLSVAHFNHQLRGRASDADERLVRAEARKLGLACDVGRASVRRKAASESTSVEMAARELRHAFLARCARKRGARIVMLAQHADDQAELFLMRLLRGAGGEGLGGMRFQSASPADRHIRLVRPLLECSKSDLLDFARTYGIRFRTDASNQSDEFDRNWVRLKLLPLLRRRHPNVERAILRSMDLAQADSEYVREAARSWLNGSDSKTDLASVMYCDLHVAVQRQIVQQQLIRLGCAPSYQLVEWLRLHPGKSISIAPGCGVMRDEKGLVHCARPVSSRFNDAQALIDLSQVENLGQAGRGEVSFGGIRLQWRLLRRAGGFAPNRRAGVEHFDADQTGPRVLLRHWRPGDRFQPIGLPGHIKLQDWFTNRKIPLLQRRQLVLAQTERGEVFWVEGERIAEVAKLTPATCRVLELRWKRI